MTKIKNDKLKSTCAALQVFVSTNDMGAKEFYDKFNNMSIMYVTLENAKGEIIKCDAGLFEYDELSEHRDAGEDIFLIGDGD